jgi:hypothetical protein
MRVLEKRLRRLEDQLGPADGKPRHYFRIVLIRLDRIPGLEGATCRRTLLPNGTVSENVVLGTSRNGRELSTDELDGWIATFPIEPMQTSWSIVRLPAFVSSPGAAP